MYYGYYIYYRYLKPIVIICKPVVGVNIWIALSPMSASTGGGLLVAPGSHREKIAQDAIPIIRKVRLEEVYYDKEVVLWCVYVCMCSCIQIFANTHMHILHIFTDIHTAHTHSLTHSHTHIYFQYRVVRVICNPSHLKCTIN